MKVRGSVPRLLEVALVPWRGRGDAFPGLFLFTSVARFVRPVQNVVAGGVEMIGSFEQLYLEIACQSHELPGAVYRELTPTSTFSRFVSQSISYGLHVRVCCANVLRYAERSCQSDAVLRLQSKSAQYVSMPSTLPAFFPPSSSSSSLLPFRFFPKIVCFMFVLFV